MKSENIEMLNPGKDSIATQEQIAAIIAVHGTKKQEAELLLYLKGTDAIFATTPEDLL